MILAGVRWPCKIVRKLTMINNDLNKGSMAPLTKLLNNSEFSFEIKKLITKTLILSKIIRKGHILHLQEFPFEKSLGALLLISFFGESRNLTNRGRVVNNYQPKAREMIKLKLI